MKLPALVKKTEVAATGVLDPLKLAKAVALAEEALAEPDPAARLLKCDEATPALKWPEYLRRDGLIDKDSRAKRRLFDYSIVSLFSVPVGFIVCLFGAGTANPLLVLGAGAVMVHGFGVALPVAGFSQAAINRKAERSARAAFPPAAKALLEKLEAEQARLLEEMTAAEAGASPKMHAVLDAYPQLEERFNREAKRAFIHDAGAPGAALPAPAVVRKNIPPV
jgi:hypothetical protein